ncbi:LRR domain containing protein [Trema orientale]|uniref:LRR domain containing protein n=1 Tax=Trema orientale TaxID=63057 RepID=A0A2P5EH71_TREOI|nr:LRR domain containing protein [Trema orientale]
MTSCLESDREALLDFKKGLNDSDSLLSTWRGSNCCQWWGIRCQSGTGAVTHVDLHNLNLEILDGDYSNRYGFWELSVEKKPLKSLKYLDLSSNRFFLAPIPEFFGSLQNLQYLNLSYAEFTGEIPSSLGNLSSLQYLDLSGNFILSKVPDWLVNVSSLTTVNMANCGLYGRIPLGLADLPNLEILRLNSNSLDASSFQLLRGRWEKIQILDLGSNRISGKLPRKYEYVSHLFRSVL